MPDRLVNLLCIAAAATLAVLAACDVLSRDVAAPATACFALLIAAEIGRPSPDDRDRWKD